MLKIWRTFRSDSRGSTAIEFGLIAAPLIASFMMILEVGLGYMASAQLDLAAFRASEAVRQGAAQGLDLPTFKRKYVCPNLKGLDCDKLTVQIDALAMFRLAPPPTLGSESFNYGSSGSIVAVQLTYPFPVYTNYLTGPVVSYGGSTVLPISAAVGTINRS